MANNADKQDPPSLDDFGDRLKAVRGEESGAETSSGSGGAAMGRALRVTADLLAGLFIGVLLGLLFDRLLGTTPWLLLIGIALGFAAGVLNVFRTFNNSETPSDDG